MQTTRGPSSSFAWAVLYRACASVSVHQRWPSSRSRSAHGAPAMDLTASQEKHAEDARAQTQAPAEGAASSVPRWGGAAGLGRRQRAVRRSTCAALWRRWGLSRQSRCCVSDRCACRRSWKRMERAAAARCAPGAALPSSAATAAQKNLATMAGASDVKPTEAMACARTLPATSRLEFGRAKLRQLRGLALTHRGCCALVRCRPRVWHSSGCLQIFSGGWPGNVDRAQVRDL